MLPNGLGMWVLVVAGAGPQPGAGNTASTHIHLKIRLLFTPEFYHIPYALFNLSQHYRIFVYVPMNTPNLHPLCLQQCPMQAKPGFGLCAVRIHHSLAPYHYTLHPSKTKEGCFRAGNMEHLSHVRPRALMVDVSRLPSPPAVPPLLMRLPVSEVRNVRGNR